MNVAQIFKADTANGLGMRLSVFVSGCRNHCKGCFQPETWDFNYGQKYTPKMEEMIVSEVKKPYYKGLTILGGDPFEPENQEGIISLIRKVKDIPGKDIWAYTGYTIDEDLIPGGKRFTEYTDEILKNLDVLVDGKFILEQKVLGLKFRGSANQRLINVPAFLETGEPVTITI